MLFSPTHLECPQLFWQNEKFKHLFMKYFCLKARWTNNDWIYFSTQTNRNRHIVQSNSFQNTRSVNNRGPRIPERQRTSTVSSQAAPVLTVLGPSQATSRDRIPQRGLILVSSQCQETAAE